MQEPPPPPPRFASWSWSTTGKQLNYVFLYTGARVAQSKRQRRTTSDDARGAVHTRGSRCVPCSSMLLCINAKTPSSSSAAALPIEAKKGNTALGTLLVHSAGVRPVGLLRTYGRTDGRTRTNVLSEIYLCAHVFVVAGVRERFDRNECAARTRLVVVQSRVLCGLWGSKAVGRMVSSDERMIMF